MNFLQNPMGKLAPWYVPNNLPGACRAPTEESNTGTGRAATGGTLCARVNYVQ